MQVCPAQQGSEDVFGSQDAQAPTQFVGGGVGASVGSCVGGAGVGSCVGGCGVGGLVGGCGVGGSVGGAGVGL